MKSTKILLLLFFLVVVGECFSMERIRRTNNFLNYKDHANEIGYALGVSYLRFENSFAPQLQMHYAKYFNNFFSLGFGYGGIFDQHFHNTLTFEPAFRIFNNLIITGKPGFTIKTNNSRTVLLYSVGISANYEFKISEYMHIGPKVEMTMMQDDFNYVAAFHMGFTF